MMTHEERLTAAGIKLPEGYSPAGLYVGCVQTGDLLHIGGHGPVKNDGKAITGKVGGSIDLETAYEAARLTGLQILTTAKKELGSLNRIIRVVKVFGLSLIHI